MSLSNSKSQYIFQQVTFVKNTSSNQISTYKITWPFGVTFREHISNTKATTETVGNPLKYSGHALDIAASSSSIFAREDDMFKLSVMDNIEINCQVPTLNMPVTTFHDLRNCSSPDSQYKSLEKKKRKIKTPSLDKDSKMEWKACVS